MDTKARCAALAMALVFGMNSGLAYAQTNTISLTLSIAPPTTGAPITIEVDTLTTELATLTRPSSLTIEGTIDAELDYRVIGGELVPQSFRFVGGDISQNDLGELFPIGLGGGAGNILFQSTNIHGTFETIDQVGGVSTVFVDALGVFDSSDVRLTQSSGRAEVQISQKPILGVQSLGGNDVAISELLGQQTPLGLIEVERIGSNGPFQSFSVDVSFDLFGRQLRYDRVGLPTSLRFGGGSILATGVVTIPEPSTAVLLTLCLSGAALVSQRRRR